MVNRKKLKKRNFGRGIEVYDSNHPACRCPSGCGDSPLYELVANEDTKAKAGIVILNKNVAICPYYVK